MPTATLKRIAKQPGISITMLPAELDLMHDIMFRAVVSCMMELNGYTRDGQNGTEFQRQTVRELEYLRSLQTKFQNATTRIKSKV
jgi:hypothetical protein